MANKILVNPNSAAPPFGWIDAYQKSGLSFPAGPILLKTGKHIGPNRGFGAVHIWAEHAAEMASVGFSSYEEVPAYVATIVCPGASLYYEASRLRGNFRLAILRSARGTAIVEAIDTAARSHYSVVTAFSNAKAHGTRIGTVREFIA